MQKEKIAAIGLVIIIVIALSAFLIFEYGDEIFGNIFGESETIELGDCVDVHYIGRYASNNSVFDTSYDDVENKTGGIPLKMFVSLEEDYPPEGYDAYQTGIKGFIEGLVGMKEGDSATIGPIPPERAYGVIPKAGDVISFSDPETGQTMDITILQVTENASMPVEYIELLGDINTTLYLLRFDTYSVGDELTWYPAWTNATVVTKINDTLMWMYTTPPADKMENFTWVDNTTQSSFWVNASGVTSMDNATIIITHNPEIGAEMTYSVDWWESTVYTVVNLTDDKINVSYIDDTGNTSYTEFDRVITIERNTTQEITFSYPQAGLEQLIDLIKMYYDPDLTYSFHELADQSLIFEVVIVEVHKTSS